MTCQNIACRKSNLDSVSSVYDYLANLIVCTECYIAKHPEAQTALEARKVKATANVHEPIQYDVRYSNENGLAAQVRYGDVTFGVHASNQEIQRFLGR